MAEKKKKNEKKKCKTTVGSCKHKAARLERGVGVNRRGLFRRKCKTPQQRKHLHLRPTGKEITP